jgi:nitric oxide reductase NorQ protein
LKHFHESLPCHIQEQLRKRREIFSQLSDKKPSYESPDESILTDAIIALLIGKNVLLKGPTGSGKTKLAETIASLFQQPMQSINCSVDLDAEALLGYKTISKEQGDAYIEFVPGPVIRSMKKGELLYIDEINMAKPETLPILNGVLDYRRQITNFFTGEQVDAAPSFGVIAAINEGYVGTVLLNEALKNRFVVIDVPYIQGEGLKRVLEEQSQKKEEHLIRTFVSLSADLVAQVKNGQISEEAASIRALLDAIDLAAYLPPMRAVKRAIADKLEDEREKTAIMNIAETYFG